MEWFSVPGLLALAIVLVGIVLGLFLVWLALMATYHVSGKVIAWIGMGSWGLSI